MLREVDNVGKFAKGYKLIALAIKYDIKFDNNKLQGAKYDTLITKGIYKSLKDK